MLLRPCAWRGEERPRASRAAGEASPLAIQNTPSVLKELYVERAVLKGSTALKVIKARIVI